ncbi:hypothetical protein C8R44DRAFT_942367 [Mycena epipterygia]|nr:hypothetical protein C8R44DRAFT_942367 [Mycena epipterygia]
MAQVLNGGATRVNIRVVPRPEEEVSDVPVSDFIARFKSFEWRDHRPAEIPNARMISPWLMRTRWHEHILPYRPHSAELRELVAIPNSHDPLAALHESVTQYFFRATALIDGTDELVLQKLNSKNPDKDGINNTPLHAHHQKDTLRGYALVISHFLAGLLRTSPHYKFPTSMELEHALAAFLAVGSEVDKQPALHSVLMALWKTQWPASPECHFPDPTMCFLTLFSFKESGTFADPKETTGPIARLCRGIQLAMLKEIHRLVDSGECPTQMAAFDLVRPFVVEKEMTTFNSLMSLQHYASALAFQTMSYPNIWWVDRENWTELLYKGNRITLAHLGQIFTELEAKIIDLWENKVMLGLGLNVKYGVLAENLGNTNAGYSFLDDVSNPFHALKHAFADALLARPDIMAKFVTVDSAGNERPNMVFCRQWLMGLAELEGLVMLDTDMISGGPARGTELAAMLAKNGELRGRNLRALGRFLSIVREYDKTTNNMQSDRLIPLAVSAVNADILIQLHTFARPWAQFLASFVFPGKPAVILQYAEMLFMDFGKEFTSDKLSSLMVQSTGPILGWEMKISYWRHIFIAFRRKLCAGAGSLEDIEEDATSTVNAMQSGHSLPTENRVYGLSPDALLGAPEDVLYLFLRASTEWQKAMKVVPGGLALPYKEARTHDFDSLVLRGVFTTKTSVAVAPLPMLNVNTPAPSASFQQMIADFQKRSNHAHATIIAKQDETLREIAGLRQELAAFRTQMTGNTAVPPIVTPPRMSLPFTFFNSLGSLKKSAEHPPQDFGQLIEFESPQELIASAAPPDEATDPAAQKDLLVYLRQLYGPNADWKDAQQYRAVRALLALDRDIIVAMRTGGGKSAVAILPSMVEQGYTVIIVPLIALMEDWCRRLDELHVGYERFLGSKGPATLSGKHNLILVSSDVATGSRWRKAITQLNSGGRPVLRYVVDEVQYYFTDNGFRGPLGDPFKLRQFPCQIVLMSGTIPEAAEKFLIKAFELSHPKRFSTFSTRPELSVCLDFPHSSLKS